MALLEKQKDNAPSSSQRDKPSNDLGGSTISTPASRESEQRDQVTPHTIAVASVAAFDLLDADHNRRVSKTEVGKLLTHNFTDATKETNLPSSKVIAGLYAITDSLSQFGSKNGEINEAGFTKAAAQEFAISTAIVRESNGNIPPAEPLDYQMIAARRILVSAGCNSMQAKLMNVDANGVYSSAALKTLESETADPNTYIATRYLRIHGKELLEKNGCLTFKDVRDITDKFDKEYPLIKAHSIALEAISNVEHAASYDLTLFPNGLASISPNAITQGSIGDCYLLSAIASVANVNPQIIVNSIKPTKEGKFEVTFKGAPSESFLIAPPTRAETAVFNQLSNYGIWASVVEKAYGAYLHKHGLDKEVKNRELPIQESAGLGGSSIDSLRILTGKEPTRWIIEQDGSITKATKSMMQAMLNSFTSQDLEKVLKEAFSANPQKPVCATIYKKADSKLFTQQTSFYDRHEYTILGYDSATQTVAVRNPWGKGIGAKGECTLHISRFKEIFNAVTIGDY